MLIIIIVSSKNSLIVTSSRARDCQVVCWETHRGNYFFARVYVQYDVV